RRYFPSILLIAWLTVGSLMMVSPANAQQRPTGVKVVGVRVEGAQTADPGLIVANSGLIVGKEVVGDDIQKAIQRIWSLNLFRYVEVLIEREVGESAFFLIRVEEYPRINNIEIKGNKKINNADVNDAISIYKGQVLRPSRIQNARKKLLAS